MPPSVLLSLSVIKYSGSSFHFYPPFQYLNRNSSLFKLCFFYHFRKDDLSLLGHIVLSIMLQLHVPLLECPLSITQPFFTEPWCLSLYTSLDIVEDRTRIAYRSSYPTSELINVTLEWKKRLYNMINIKGHEIICLFCPGFSGKEGSFKPGNTVTGMEKVTSLCLHIGKQS